MRLVEQACLFLHERDGIMTMMKRDDAVAGKIKILLGQQKLAVLATQSDG